MRTVAVVTRDGRELEFQNARVEMEGTKLRVKRGSKELDAFSRASVAYFSETLTQAVQQA